VATAESIAIPGARVVAFLRNCIFFHKTWGKGGLVVIKKLILLPV